MKTTLAILVASSTLTAGVAMMATPTAMPAQAFQISIGPDYGSTGDTGASALLDFNFSQSGDRVQLDLGIENTTNGTKGLGATAATLIGVAYEGPEIDPDDISLASYDKLSSNFSKLWNIDGEPPNLAIPVLQGLGVFDIAFSLERENFDVGSADGGLEAGESTAVRFLFNTDYAADDLSDALEAAIKNNTVAIAGRFEQVNAGGGSDNVLGGIPANNSVPEPTTMAASILALGGLGFLKKKFKQKQAV
ncbi:hypothetical protein A6770_00295 [Nostoc minutum NIES-26]|uniref:PEP-CTERM protein-sorting domain-containing protein n=1 Tax=Nostoc minutum NIES-26 TaxID=1844469 RepID=A0A367QZZ0_9NOSO|nr:hypothetical protein A6770_00295 [Nostoc minutum NIES-26]